MPAPLLAQTGLRQEIRAIAREAHGRVSVACALPGTALDCNINGHGHPPMQSVFKLPLVLTALHIIERDKWALDRPVRFRASDRILPHTHSPLQDRYPGGEVDVPIRELLRLTVSESDNVAADIVLRTVGGPRVVDEYLRRLGVRGFHLEDDEAAMARDERLQYRNWFEPASAVRLLRLIADRPPLSGDHAALLGGWMRDAPERPARLRGQMPAETVILHKTGSSGTVNGFTAAWNDIGLIALPDGRRLAIAVFVSDSKADDATRASVVARIAKTICEAALQRAPR